MAFIEALNSSGGGGVNFKSDTFTSPTNGSLSINVGFKPKKLTIYFTGSTASAVGSGLIAWVYDEDYTGTTKFLKIIRSGTTYTGAVSNFDESNSNTLVSIDNSGFTVKTNTNSDFTAKEWRYIAVG